MKTIAFFNNKGGVGKTTLAYHVAWMLGELGLTVLAADLDPQANLTSMFLDEDAIEALWWPRVHTDKANTIYASVDKLKRGLGDISEVEQCGIANSDRLFLVPGDLGLSDFESDLAAQWPNCLDRDERAFRVTTSFFRIIRHAAEESGADVVLIDVGPNLGAINRTALLAADYVVIPLGPDIFSLQGLRNMGPRLRAWRKDWDERKKKNPSADLALPPGTMQPIGYVTMRHAVRRDRPAAWFGKWIARMPEAYLRDVLDDKTTEAPSAQSDPNCLGQMKDYKSLMPMAQEANKPMFLLKPADGAIGGHQSAVRNCYEDFERLSQEIARRCDLPLRSDIAKSSRAKPIDLSDLGI
ncbi:MAG: AAA family ATPase [Defluviicoccus sp.]|nr:AAA family ATPase [Defluviicoccus sp.]